MSDKKTKDGKKFNLSAVIIAAVVALAVGCGAGALGYKFLSPTSPAALVGSTTVSEDKLDSTIGTYTYQGTTYDVTVRDAIQESSSLDAAKQDDGTYQVPTADSVLSFARYQIVQKEAESRDISVTDEDMDSYASDTLGTTDYSTIASTYSMDEDQVKALIKQSAMMKKLQEQVVEGEPPSAPTAPTAPEDGNEDTANADYAKYVIDLVGDEWDAEKNTWARTDGDYYASLSTFTISNDSATYGAAEAAYNVAALKYQTGSSEYSKQWNEYLNGLLSNASISVNTLVG